MKKYIILSVIVLMFAFSFINNAYAKTNLTTSEVKAVAEILRTLKVSENDIARITAILKETETNSAPLYNSQTGKLIVPVPPQPIKPLTGCEDNSKYNTKTGKPCSDYKAPKYTGGAQA